MGNLEKAVKIKNKKANLQKIILGTIFVVGTLSVALVAPKMLKVLSKLEPDFLKRKLGKYSVNRSFKRLKDAGLIIFKKTEKGNFAELTEKGKAKLRKLELCDFKLKKTPIWDGKWRVLIFDIKNKRKGLRDKIRLTLKKIGFIYLQRSVWVYPYDCEDLITLLKADFEVGKDLLYIIADSIENDKKLRKDFKLDFC
jgi:DNA-binding PadR family transcriptional regulator